MLSAISERQFQAQVIALARLAGWTWYFTHDSRRSPAGFPDLILVRGGQLVAAELKRERGRLTDPQREWLTLLGAVPGVIAECWKPSSWARVEAVLMPRPDVRRREEGS